MLRLAQHSAGLRCAALVLPACGVRDAETRQRYRLPDSLHSCRSLATKPLRDSASPLQGLLRQQRTRLTTAAFLACTAGCADACLAYSVQPFLDRVVISHAGAGEATFAAASLGLAALACVKVASRYAQQVLVRRSVTSVVSDLRISAVHTMVRSQVSVGSALSRVSSDLTILHTGMVQILTHGVTAGVSMLALIGVAVYRSPELAGIAVAVLPAVAATTGGVGARVRRFAERAMHAQSGVAEVTEAAVAHRRFVRVFDLYDKVNEQLVHALQLWRRQCARLAVWESMAGPSAEAVAMLGLAGIVYVGGRACAQGTMSPGELVSFLTSLALVYTPMRRVAESWTQSQVVATAEARVSRSLVLQPVRKYALQRKAAEAVADAAILTLVQPRTGEIVSVDAGDIMAVTGASGAGKTSLLAKIAGVAETRAVPGQIWVRGVDCVVGDVPAHWLSYVQQEPVSWPGSVEENLRLVSGKETSHAALLKAMEIAAIPPSEAVDLLHVPASAISLGQLQRVCVARAVLRRAPLMLLDEPTSALDYDAAATLMRGLRRYVAESGTALVVVTHDTFVASCADRILSLSQPMDV